MAVFLWGHQPWRAPWTGALLLLRVFSDRSGWCPGKNICLGGAQQAESRFWGYCVGNESKFALLPWHCILFLLRWEAKWQK
jgi:hypothetical protein